jgi:hypothetical protein
MSRLERRLSERSKAKFNKQGRWSKMFVIKTNHTNNSYQTATVAKLRTTEEGTEYYGSVMGHQFDILVTPEDIERSEFTLTNLKIEDIQKNSEYINTLLQIFLEEGLTGNKLSVC